MCAVERRHLDDARDERRPDWWKERSRGDRGQHRIVHVEPVVESQVRSLPGHAFRPPDVLVLMRDEERGRGWRWQPPRGGDEAVDDTEQGIRRVAYSVLEALKGFDEPLPERDALWPGVLRSVITANQRRPRIGVVVLNALPVEVRHRCLRRSQSPSA